MNVLRNALLSAFLLGCNSAYATETAQDKFPTGHWVSKWYLEQHSPEIEQFHPFSELDFVACGTSICGRIVKAGKCEETSMVLTREASGNWSGTWTLPEMEWMKSRNPDEGVQSKFDIRINFNSSTELVWESDAYATVTRRSLGYSAELIRKSDNVCAPAA